jgi:hypothetical protein
MKNSTPSREDRLRALVDVGRAISASLAHEDILAQICTHAARLLNTESAVMTERREHCKEGTSPCLMVVATSPDASISLGEHLSMEGSLALSPSGERSSSTTSWGMIARTTEWPRSLACARR